MISRHLNKAMFSHSGNTAIKKEGCPMVNIERVPTSADSVLNGTGRGSEAPNGVIRPKYWLYRNCCYFGMQMERYLHRFWRKTKKLLRPIGTFFSARIGKVKDSAVTVRDSFTSVIGDIGTNNRTIGAVRREKGVLASTKVFFRAIPRAFAKHGHFVETVINYTLPLFCIAILIAVVTAKFGQNYVLKVECDGNTVGYISDERTYTEANELVGERIVISSDEFKNALTPTYSLAAVDDSMLTDADSICENILYNTDDVAEGYGFFIDGELIGVVESQGDLKFILEDFLEKYRIGAANETMSFIGEQSTVYGLYAVEKILTSEEFRNRISSEDYKSLVYTVDEDDTLQSILKKYKMTEERFMELNSGFDGSLTEGSTVVVEKLQPVLRVKSLVVSSYEKDIAYSTITEKDPSLYVGTSKVKVEGVNGKQKITQQITYVDGNETARTIINKETLREPTNKVVLVGTKVTTTTKKPTQKTKKTGGGSNYTNTAPANSSNVGTGRFTWPVPGVNHVSSYYGPRWGRFHKGIDITQGGVYGRTIVAADTGTVTTVSRTSGGYGLHVIITHSNGYSTVYAHCSSVMVSAGQRVSKGQAIARVGSTGNSTGPHLHFEVRKNGSHTNPMNYF